MSTVILRSYKQVNIVLQQALQYSSESREATRQSSVQYVLCVQIRDYLGYKLFIRINFCLIF